MNARLTTTSIICSLFIGHAAIAAGPAVKNQFASGQKAVASQVNENFQELADRIQTNTESINTNTTNITNNTTAINSNAAATTTLSNTVAGHTAALAALTPPVTYDYQDYSVPTSIASKIFSSTSINGLGAGTTITFSETITRSTSGNNTNVTVRRLFPADGRVIEFDYLATPASYNFVEERDYPPSIATPSTTFTLANPVPERTSTMQVGKMFGSASDITVSGTSTTPGMIEVINSLVSAEPITINVNGTDTTYNDCVKIMMTRFNTTGAYGGNMIQTNWYCNGIGLVKRMAINTTTGTANLILLTGTTSN